MKRQIYFLFFIFLLLPEKGNCYHISSNTSGNDSSIWLRKFKEFRNAIYLNDKNKVKSFIDFPILNINNEIWYLAYAGDIRKLEEIPEEIIPFTEKDFDVYYSKIFADRFRKAILKIRSQELYDKGETTTILMAEDSSTYYIHALLKDRSSILKLSLHSRTILKNVNGEISDVGEGSINYYFEILKNGKLKFRYIRVAG